MTPNALVRTVALVAVTLAFVLPAEARKRSSHRTAVAHATTSATTHAKGAQPERDKAIEKLAPEARIEQRCNARAMGAISREHPDLAPDELVAYAFADPDTDTEKESIAAPGAAVRSKGHWYHLAYRCQTTADGLDVVAFSYDLGNVVPREDWSAHYLVP